MNWKKRWRTESTGHWSAIVVISANNTQKWVGFFCKIIDIL